MEKREYELLLDPLSSPSAFGKKAAIMEKIEVEPPEENKEVEVTLRDPQTMGSIKVRAIFSRTPPEEGEWARVWFTKTGVGRSKDPWFVKILEEIEEEEEEVTIKPRRRLSLGERKGRMLEELLKQREASEKEKA